MKNMNALEKLRNAREFLESSGIDDANREAEFIISHCIGIDRVTLYKDNPQVPEDVGTKIDTVLKRRSHREPLQYIFGYAEFYGLKITVGPGVLIPRPETELLVEEAIKTVRSQESGVMSQVLNPPLPPFSFASANPPECGKGGQGGITKFEITLNSSLNILDLCTGSGCIALALAKEFPDAEVYGTDTSEIAIRYAQGNADMNRIKNVFFLKGNLFDPVKNSNLKFDLIVSNPPYIRRDEIKDLQPEIKDWEPVEALNGGEDGLDYYRMIIPEAKNYLKEHGFLMFELGISQAEAVKKMAVEAGFENISLIKDYAGIERILIMNL